MHLLLDYLTPFHLFLQSQQFLILYYLILKGYFKINKVTLCLFIKIYALKTNLLMLLLLTLLAFYFSFLLNLTRFEYIIDYKVDYFKLSLIKLKSYL